ncbi:MAG: beta-propeller fold lactonase family protein, partial [Pirellulales bacterium]
MTIIVLGASLDSSLAAESAADEFYVYLSIGNQNKISVYKLDQTSGELSAVQQVDVGGAPGALAVDPQQKFLYAAVRTGDSVATLSIDPKTGKL